jgi:hypothetical protein
LPAFIANTDIRSARFNESSILRAAPGARKKTILSRRSQLVRNSARMATSSTVALASPSGRMGGIGNSDCLYTRGR